MVRTTVRLLLPPPRHLQGAPGPDEIEEEGEKDSAGGVPKSSEPSGTWLSPSRAQLLPIHRLAHASGTERGSTQHPAPRERHQGAPGTPSRAGREKETRSPTRHPSVYLSPAPAKCARKKEKKSTSDPRHARRENPNRYPRVPGDIARHRAAEKTRDQWHKHVAHHRNQLCPVTT
jgi:hypothetical protein